MATTEQRASNTWAPDTLETAVLVLLKQQPSHGYALLGPIQEFGVEIGDLSRLYRSLRSLESEGVLASKWDTAARGRGPARRIYFLTRQGNRYLRQQIKALRENKAVLSRIDAQYVDLVGDGG